MFRLCLTTMAAATLIGGAAARAEKHVEVNAPGVHVSVDKNSKKDTKKEARRPASFRLVQASQVIGDKVLNPDGQKIGTIRELAFDTSRRKIAYAIVDLNGLAGGDNYYAVPYRALTNQPDSQGKFVLDIEKGRLKDAKGFAKSNWPDMTDQAWAKDIHAFYGQTPNLQGEPISTERRVVKRGLFKKDTVVVENKASKPNILKTNSEVIGHSVRHASNGETIGQVNDLFVDATTGDIALVLLQLDRKSSAVPNSPDKDFVALPIQMFTFDRHGDPDYPYTVECCFIKLRDHRFSASNWPDLTSKAWVSGIYDDFGRNPYWNER